MISPIYEDTWHNRSTYNREDGYIECPYCDAKHCYHDLAYEDYGENDVECPECGKPFRIVTLVSFTRYGCPMVGME